tara:strand:+ start:115 stop:606 length:492 start_codon:yes stop_codon:yes gene_type:complete
MFTAEINPEINDEEFARLFDSSWESMKDFIPAGKEQALAGHKASLRRFDTIVAVYEDGYLLTMLCGVASGSELIYKTAYFGQNEAGSRSYAYTTDWSDAIDDLMSANFDEYHISTLTQTPIEAYDIARRDLVIQSRGNALESKDQIINGEQFHGIKYNTVRGN